VPDGDAAPSDGAELGATADDGGAADGVAIPECEAVEPIPEQPATSSMATASRSSVLMVRSYGG
jgi:hypothetical protein